MAQVQKCLQSRQSYSSKSNSSVLVPNKKNSVKRLEPIVERARKCLPILHETIPVKDLTQWDVNKYRLDHYENLCLRLLEAGYHETFKELTNLNKIQLEQREKAGPASALWNQTLLRDRRDQLPVLVRYLMDTENALLQRNFDLVYRKLLSIACYFRASDDDRWLVQYFLHRSNDTAQNTIRIASSARAMRSIARTEHFVVFRGNQKYDDDQDAVLDEILETARRRLMESTYHLITFLMENGQHLKAMLSARNLYTSLKYGPPHRVAPIDPEKEIDPEWTSNARSMIAAVSEKICECTLKMMRSQIGKEADVDNSFTLLEALDFAEESGNEGLVGDCKLRLSEEYENQHEVEEALQFASQYYQLARKLDSTKHRIEACKAMATIYQKLSRINDAKEYLVELGTLSENCDDPDMSADVATLLARFHVIQSQDLQQAREFADHGFQLTLHTNENKTSTSSTVSTSHSESNNEGKILPPDRHLRENVLRIWCGVAKGSALQSTLMPIIVQSQDDECIMDALLNWRSLNIPLPPIGTKEFLKNTKSSFAARLEAIRQKPNAQQSSTEEEK